MRGADSNGRTAGYEPAVVPLHYPATRFYPSDHPTVYFSDAIAFQLTTKARSIKGRSLVATAQPDTEGVRPRSHAHFPNGRCTHQLSCPPFGAGSRPCATVTYKRSS